MNKNTQFSLALAALLLFGLSIAIPVAAQLPADEGDQNTGTFSATVERIKIDAVEFFQLEAQLEEVEPGFRSLLRSRLDERGREIFEQVDALAQDLLESDRRGEPIDEYRAQIVEWLETLLERANAFIARNRQIIVELLEEQSRTDPAKAAESVVNLDRAIERTARVNRNLYRMIERLDDFGVDVAEERSQLATRVREAAEMLAVAIHLDADELAKLRDRRLRADEQTVARSLHGNWREEHLFALSQALAHYDFLTEQIAACSGAIDRMLASLPTLSVEEAPKLPRQTTVGFLAVSP